jgi:hypothetical protein
LTYPGWVSYTISKEIRGRPMKIKLMDAARERLNEITLTKKDNKAFRIYVTSIG